MGLDERQWDSSKNVKLAPDKEVVLTGDRSINSLRTSANKIDKKENVRLYLNGYKLSIGSGGVIMEAGRSQVITGGILTANSGTLRFTAIGNPVKHILPIYSVISDNGAIKVGLEIVNTGTDYNGIGLSGGKANTFTGDVNIKGKVLLDLYKSAGAVSVLGNLNIKDGAKVSIFKSGQIGRGSHVLLSSKTNIPTTFGFNGAYEENLREVFHALKVDGNVVVSFSLDDSKKPHGTRELIIDDLQVLEGSHLLVKKWLDGRDRLLVRKDSAHVHESLKRIEFENHDTRSVNLRNYDQDYWEIYALVPEPTSYGALFGAVGLMVAWWRQQRGQKSQESQ